MQRRHVCAIAVLFFLAAVTPAAGQIPIAYRVVDIGTLGGDWMVGVAINNNGDIVGSASLPDGTLHAFRWTVAGGVEDLGANGGAESHGFGINDNGDVVGVYFDHEYVGHPFIARLGDVMRDLSTIAGERVRDLYAITNDGRVAGSTWFGGQAFRTLTTGALQTVADNWSVAQALNDAGDVAGWKAHYVGDELMVRAFRYSDTLGFEDLGTFGGNRSTPLAMNNHGTVVGWSETAPGSRVTHAFRARPGFPLEDLGSLPGIHDGHAIAYGINDAGDVVGQSATSWYVSPFRYTDSDGMIDLAPLIPLAARQTVLLYGAFATNDARQIGVLYSGSGLKSWLLTPVYDKPAPVIVHVAAGPAVVLSPPDNRMVTVWVDATATDEYDAAPVCRIASVTNSEDPKTGADPDVQILAYPLSVNLRATRLGSGLGRIYTLNVSCSNYFGGTTTGQVVVQVPHDSAQSK